MLADLKPASSKARTPLIHSSAYRDVELAVLSCSPHPLWLSGFQWACGEPLVASRREALSCPKCFVLFPFIETSGMSQYFLSFTHKWIYGEREKLGSQREFVSLSSPFSHYFLNSNAMYKSPHKPPVWRPGSLKPWLVNILVWACDFIIVLYMTMSEAVYRWSERALEFPSLWCSGTAVLKCTCYCVWSSQIWNKQSWFMGVIVAYERGHHWMQKECCLNPHITECWAGHGNHHHLVC